MRTRLFSLILVLGGLFVLPNAWSQALPQAGWVTEVVHREQNVDIGSPFDFALTKEDQPQFVYNYSNLHTDSELFFASLENGSWHWESLGFPGGVWSISALALNGQDLPRIGYTDVTFTRPHFVFLDEDGWHREIVDTAGALGAVGYALDGNDVSHFVYSTFEHPSSRYAIQENGGWRIEYIADDSMRVWNPSLAISNGNVPTIAFYERAYDNSGTDLTFGYLDGAGWHFEYVDSVGHLYYSGAEISLRVDVNGEPHISYYDGLQQNLKYAYRDDSGWHIETVDVDEKTGLSSSLQLDLYGNPHIAYSYLPSANNNDLDLRYAYRGAVGWIVETVDEEGFVGIAPSLAMDRNGNPSIGYAAIENEDHYLKLARNQAPTSIQLAEFTADWSNPTPLTLLILVAAAIVTGTVIYSIHRRVRGGMKDAARAEYDLTDAPT